jgi:hypothetical protein
VATGVGNWFEGGGSHELCEVASRYLGASCCPELVACNQDERLSDVLQSIGHLASSENRRLSFDEVIAEIRRDRPVGVRVRWRQGPLGHVMVISGYICRQGERWLVLEDSLFGHNERLVREFPNFKIPSTWNYSYLTS